MIDALLADILKALAQLRDGRTLGYLALSAIGALVVLAASISSVGWILGGLAISGIGWLDESLQWAGTAAALVIGWFIYPLVIAAILGLFADQICDAVEHRHYPGLPPARGLSLGASISEAINFLGMALLLNILVLPLYLLPGPNIIIYLGLNGWLLGREFFDSVGFRRLPRDEHRRLRRHLRFDIWVAGIAIAALLLIPLVNLLAPVIGLALMVHQYQRQIKSVQFN